MISEAHLKNWLNEMKYQLISIEKEITVAKLKHITEIKIDVGISPIREDVYVSFEYLREKALILAHLVKNIEIDMKNFSIDPSLGAKEDAKRKFHKDD